VTSLLVAGLTRRIDRRPVVTGFTVLLILSGLALTFAPNYLFLMVGRALLGVFIGGFWSMSTSIVMRLVPGDMVPRGLAMLNAGNAIAATVVAPLGSFLGLRSAGAAPSSSSSRSACWRSSGSGSAFRRFRHAAGSYPPTCCRCSATAR
jgi:MFS family permease